MRSIWATYARRSLHTFALALLLTPSALSAQTPTLVNNLMPQPAQLQAGSGALTLTSTFSIHTNLQDVRLAGAIDRTRMRLQHRIGLHLETSADQGTRPTLQIDVQRAGEPIQTLEEDESYQLSVTPDGAHLMAPTVLGALHGMETLLQLVQPAGDHFIVPAVTINDRPRFRWRGLMVDCGRHFEPLPMLKRTIDGMAAVKLDVFHWHLIDDQGFRVESKLFPKLTALGSDGLFYTQDQIREIVTYARDRGIRVVPEFEMPGHSVAWLVAYPELASGIKPTGIRREFGVSDVALDPTREETYTFIQRFLGEMVTLFPDAYVHIGGDETVSPDWRSNPRILAFMQAHNLKDPDALQAYFNQHILKILTGLHKHMVGWDEILNPALPHDVVVQSWRGQASLAKGAQEGYQGLLSAGYYLDGMQPAGQMYLVDPIPADTPLTPEQQKLILGGEVAMWSEQVHEPTIDSRIWPRSAAIAERFWSPADRHDGNDMYRRLDVVSVELEGLGLHHLSQEDAGLRALVQSQDIDALRTFASVLEPVSFGERYKQQHTSQLTVLDHFVDAVRPDPPSRYRIAELTDALLKSHGSDRQAANALLAEFSRVQASLPEVRQQMQASPLLEDVRPRTDQFANLAKIAGEAINAITQHQKPPAEWHAHASAAIQAAEQPGGIVRFTFIDPLKQLVEAAGAQ